MNIYVSTSDPKPRKTIVTRFVTGGSVERVWESMEVINLKKYTINHLHKVNWDCLGVHEETIYIFRGSLSKDRLRTTDLFGLIKALT